MSQESPEHAFNADGRQILEQQQIMLRARMNKVKHKIAVISGKGGVGKTVVAVNLAVAFAQRSNLGRVGIFDADIHGPCVPKMMGIKGQMLQAGPPGAFPAEGPLGIKVVSMDFLLPSQETPVVWRGPLKMTAIRQFLSDIVWGELEYLLIDLPPGTGDEPLSVMQLLPEMDGVVIVTIPSEVSKDVVKKAVTFAKQLNVPVIGIIENLSGFVCPNCGEAVNIFSAGGGEGISRDLEVPFLGKIPIDPKICEDSDKGLPFITEHPDSPATKAFMGIVQEIEDYIRKGPSQMNKSITKEVK